MPTLYVTRGLPGSGKTFWAKEWVAAGAGRRARVNRDDLRSMAHDGRFIKGVSEPQVIATRDAVIRALLRQGVDVVCDDTNLKSRVVRDLAKLARQAGADFETVNFTDVPLDICIIRDARRESPVGETVLREMHAQYLKGRALPLPTPEGPADPDRPQPYEPKPGTPTAVLVDIDGTIALADGRSPYDETRVHEDQPNHPVVDVVRAMRDAGHRIVFMSGRTEGCRQATEEWLAAHLTVAYDGLLMRPVGDMRKDAVVKAELFDQHIRDVYDIACVLDDRRQVVEMWRSMGLTVLQVAEGEF